MSGCANKVWLRWSALTGTAALDNNLFSDFRVSFSNVVTDEFVHCLRLRRSCRFTGTDRPWVHKR